MSRPRRRAAEGSPLELLEQAQRLAEAIAAAQGPGDPVVPRPAPEPVDITTAKDARGYPRTIATTPQFHLGREPLNKGKRYKANPPTVAENMAMLGACDETPFGRRLYAAQILAWQGALRAFEVLALTESDLDETTGAIHVQHGKGDKAATIKMAAWAWPHLTEWRVLRAGMPNPRGALICVIDGPTAGREWSYSHFNSDLKKAARAAGVRKRMSPHQLRHAFAVQAYQAGMPLRAIQLHLRHENIGITDTYLQGLGVAESQEQVYSAPVPTVPATALLELAVMNGRKEAGNAA